MYKINKSRTDKNNITTTTTKQPTVAAPMSMSAEDEVLLPNSLVLYDWATHLSILKNFYKKSELTVKYLDDENDEVCISSQRDLECAYDVAKQMGDRLTFVLRDEKGEIVGRPQLNIDRKLLEVRKSDDSLLATNQKQTKEMLDALANKTTTTTKQQQQQKQSNSKQQQLIVVDAQWLANYMDTFKADLLSQMETRIKSLMKEQQATTPVNFADDILSSTLTSTSDVTKKAEKLFELLREARAQSRHFKAAYVEEELHSLGVLRADFVSDGNMPDGTKCQPEARFTKQWLVRNTGRFKWNAAAQFPVVLACVGGSFGTDKTVSVTSGALGETVCLSVDLVAPKQPGVYVSEWVLQCQEFQFGPRMWCTIEVVNEKNALITLVESTVASKQAATNLLDNDEQLTDAQIPEPLQPTPPPDLLDDEFVVIPDCFDLNKKWTKKKSSGSSSSSSSVSSASSSADSDSDPSFLNCTFDVEEDALAGTSTPLVSQSTNTTTATLTLHKTTETTSSEQQSPKKKKGSKRAAKLEAAAAAAAAEAAKKEQEQQQQSISNLIKDAWSNVRGPGDIYRVDFGLDSAIYPQTSPENPMTKLISMGFANRKLNEQLLKEYSYDIERVIQDLCERTENVRY